jgi:hypothetical protein
MRRRKGALVRVRTEIYCDNARLVAASARRVDSVE